MLPLYDELKVEIFKYINTPVSLLTVDRNWNNISKDPRARTEWLIYKYGKAHALFHAVRLGNSFITAEVIQFLLARKAIMSRYFLQRLFMHFGTVDEKLRRERSFNQVNQPAQNFYNHPPWATNLTLQNFIQLITEGHKILNDLTIRGNDMEMFHLLSSGLVTNNDPHKLELIKDLILNQRFIPFPSRPKPVYEDTIEYIQMMRARSHFEDRPSSKDGYENSANLGDIAEAMLVHPDLINMWKRIGYHEICYDFNELVMQGAFLNLFPPTSPNHWNCPSVHDIISRLGQLINCGFRLTDTVMEDALHSLKHRLNEIGDVLMDVFQVVNNKSRSDIARSCLIHTIKPEKNLKKTDLLEFLIDRIGQPEEALMNALEYYKVGFKFGANSIKSIQKIRSLSVHSNFYYWALKTYGPNSEITQKCFEDIIESRIWIDLKLQETPERVVPEKLTDCAFNSICSIYLEYCNEKVPFKTDYLQYLQLARNEEIIKPLFGIGLPIVFGLPFKYNLPFEIEYEHNRPELYNNIQNNWGQLNGTNGNETKEWYTFLEKMRYKQILLSNSNITENFKSNFEEFWERIESVVVEQPETPFY